MTKECNYKIAIIGLGYVGLPLAVAFAKKQTTVGYDINQTRITDLERGYDKTQSIEVNELHSLLTSKNLKLTSNILALRDSNIFIITVPTPLTPSYQPNLTYLIAASQTVGNVLKKGDIVIYESTTYPGCTEEDCVPILEEISGLVFNRDFFAGYSPERINPGDKINTLTKIKKVTSGSTPEIAEVVDTLYRSIITAGTHKASSIKVAEASKIIENCQRDVNISFMNELALIFDRMNIDTNDVLEAAGTKWNFLKFKPGLVGGHCISVDPYYLVSKAESLGYIPNLLVAGRKINNDIAPFIAKKAMKLMIEKGINLKDSKVLILGITFKENCPDTRNTKVADIYSELKDFGLSVDVYDPRANAAEVKNEYNIDLLATAPNLELYKGVILAVSHTEFTNMPFEVIKQNGGVLFDAKGVVDRDFIDARL